MLFLFVDHSPASSLFFFFNDTATTEIYTLSLHDALPILVHEALAMADELATEGTEIEVVDLRSVKPLDTDTVLASVARTVRSEEHTSELQSRPHLVCRLLLEKKKQRTNSQSRKQNRIRTD